MLFVRVLLLPGVRRGAPRLFTAGWLATWFCLPFSAMCVHLLTLIEGDLC